MTCLIAPGIDAAGATPSCRTQVSACLSSARAPADAGVSGVVRQYFSEGVEIKVAPATGAPSYGSSSAAYGELDAHGRIISQRHARADITDLWTGRPEAASADCYTKTEANSNLKGYTPWHTSASGTSFTYDWLDQLYSVSGARYLWNGKNWYWTYQIQYCTSGGGEVINGYHMNFIGNAIMWEARDTTSAKISWTWGNGTTGNPSSTLSFALTYGVAAIGASTQAPGGGTFAGDLGNDGRFPGIAIPSYWEAGRINTYWQSPANWPWDGTTGYAGNTGQVLYEWPMGTQIGAFYSYTDLQAFCAWGGCPAL
jgi:hypothetical protein